MGVKINLTANFATAKLSVFMGKKAKRFFQRLYRTVKDALQPAYKTATWLLKITIPISLLVTLLNYFGIVGHIAEGLNPLFAHLGLPGEASLVYITGVFLNIYSAISVIAQLPLTQREITILAVMCLIARNLIVETAAQAKTGAKARQMVLLRVSMSLLAAFLLNILSLDKCQFAGLGLRLGRDARGGEKRLGFQARCRFAQLPYRHFALQP